MSEHDKLVEKIGITHDQFDLLSKAKYLLAEKHSNQGRVHRKTGWANCKCALAETIRHLDSILHGEAEL